MGLVAFQRQSDLERVMAAVRGTEGSSLTGGAPTRRIADDPVQMVRVSDAAVESAGTFPAEVVYWDLTTGQWLTINDCRLAADRKPPKPVLARLAGIDDEGRAVYRATDPGGGYSGTLRRTRRVFCQNGQIMEEAEIETWANGVLVSVRAATGEE